MRNDEKTPLRMEVLVLKFPCCCLFSMDGFVLPFAKMNRIPSANFQVEGRTRKSSSVGHKI